MLCLVSSGQTIAIVEFKSDSSIFLAHCAAMTY